MLCLMITGFVVPSQRITEILEIQPTSTSESGDPLRSGRLARTSAWHLTLEAGQKITSGGQHQKLLAELLAVIAGKERNFADMHREAKPEAVSIYGGFYVSREYHEGVWLEPSEMKLLADCKIGWGLDVFSLEAEEIANVVSPVR